MSDGAGEEMTFRERLKDFGAKVKNGVLITLGSIGLIIGVYFSLPQDTTVHNQPIYTVTNKTWTLQRDYSITVSDMVWTVKAGFNSWDGLSIPSAATNALGVTRDDYPDASLFHDSAYSCIAVDGTGPISQEKADACLKLILVGHGCSADRAELIMRMVRAWGFTAIDRHTPESVNQARGWVSVRAR